ncbi:hypothetical protein [Kiloniella sp.]|uniref:hypothetical protein n=1 Tax=Kiloniella sp. TaxID=1938587 RepID=UPI003B02038E
MLIVIYLLYVKLSETIHINRLLGGRHLFLLNKAEKSQNFDLSCGGRRCHVRCDQKNDQGRWWRTHYQNRWRLRVYRDV